MTIKCQRFLKVLRLLGVTIISNVDSGEFEQFPHSVVNVYVALNVITLTFFRISKFERVVFRLDVCSLCCIGVR